MRRAFFALALALVPQTGAADHVLGGRDLTAGAALYAENCASCHGGDLEGQPDWQSPGSDGVLPAPPHDESGHTWHHDTALLLDYTRLGGAEALAARGVKDFKSGMPAFADVLTDDQILDILAFIRSTWPDEVREVQDMRSHATDGK